MMRVVFRPEAKLTLFLCNYTRPIEPPCMYVYSLYIYTYSDDFRHLTGLDSAVAIDIIHVERPLELLFRLPRRRDVDRLQEFLEVNLAAVVRVERPEHMLAELVGVALRKETRVHLQKLVARQLAVRTVSLHVYIV